MSNKIRILDKMSRGKYLWLRALFLPLRSQRVQRAQRDKRTILESLCPFANKKVQDLPVKLTEGYFITSLCSLCPSVISVVHSQQVYFLGNQGIKGFVDF